MTCVADREILALISERLTRSLVGPYHHIVLGPSHGASSAPPTAEQPAQERELLRFGSFGVGITFGRPALFRWTKYNMLEVVLTDRSVSFVWRPSIVRMFVSSRRGKLYFQVPLADVVGIELLTFLGRRVVWLKWREGAGTREVSIEGSFGRGSDVVRLHRLLDTQLKARPASS